MTNIDALSNITGTGNQIAVHNLQNLTSIAGLSGITNTLSNLRLSNHQSLSNLNGIQNITSLNRLSICRLHSLPNLDAFENLENLGGELKIINNGELIDFCGPNTALQNGNFTSTYGVCKNPYNPLLQYLIDGNCIA